MANKKPTRRILSLLSILVVLGAIAGYLNYQMYQSKAHDAKLRAAQQRRLAGWRTPRDPGKATEIADLRTRFFKSVYHVDMRGNSPGVTFTVPDNESWQRSEHQRIEASLSGQHYDYIVLPVEQNVRYYDRVTRLMVARWIARALRQATGKRVMSPELALRAIGARATHLDDEKVAKLARETGAQVVHILLAIVDDPPPPGVTNDDPRPHHGRVYIALTTPMGHVLRRFQSPFHDDGTHLCETLFSDLAPRVAAVLGQTSVAAPKIAHRTDETLPALPKQIDELPALATTPLANAVDLQFVAILTPSRMAYERRRLFERSLVALRDMGRDSPYRNLLTARALFYLYRRPAALKYLSSADTPAEKALRAYLNGNYPELAALAPKIHAPILRAMALIELKSLGYWYSKPNAGHNVSLSLPSAQWSTVITQADRDDDTWHAPSNAQFFANTKGLFPAFDRALDQATAGQVATGDYDPEGSDVSLFESVFDSAFKKHGPACCAHYGAKLETADIWLLYRDIAVGNLLRRLNRETNIYGLHHSAVSMAHQDEPWLAGNPAFINLYAQALADYGKTLSGGKRTYTYQRALEMAKKAVRYSGEIGRDTDIGRWVEMRAARQLGNGGRMISHWTLCKLPRCDFPSSFESDDTDWSPAALPYDNSAFRLFLNAVKTKEIDNADIQHILDTRFDGAPGKVPFVADRLIKAGHRGMAISKLRTALKDPAAPWAVYKHLGDLLIEDGKYAEASKMFMGFPDFKHPPKGSNAVATANRAYAAGAALYWQGRYKDAEPLDEVAAKLPTGAGSQYHAIEDLAMSQGRYRQAAIAAYNLARRYNDVSGYQAYLTLMQLAGMHERAEAGFRAVAPRFSGTYVWSVMFAGDRIQNKPFSHIEAWVKQYLADNSGSKQRALAAHYLTSQAGTDRRVAKAQVKAVAHFEDMTTSPEMIGRFEPPLAQQLHLKAPARMVECPHPRPGCWAIATASQGYAKDTYAGFLYAYSLLQSGKFAKSVKAFLRYDQVTPIFGERRTDAALPYLAMALAGTRNTAALKRLSKLLTSKYKDSDTDFNSQLTLAVVYGALGKNTESREALVTAFRHPTSNMWRPVAGWFQLLQTAEWVYKKTGDKQVIDRALVWAKEHEVIVPHDGWAFAFEARYAQGRKARIRAAGFAEYLDPQSLWLSKVPKSIRRRGKAWWPKHNPFTLDADKDSKDKRQISM